MKKIISIVLVLSMLLSSVLMAVPSSAADDAVAYSVNVELLDEEGKQLYVTVDVDENPGVYMTYMVLGFNTNVLEVNYYEEDGDMYPNAAAGGVFGGKQWTTDIAVYDGTSNMANQYGYVGYVNVMCTPATSNVTFANNTKTGNLFEVVFDVKEGMECEDFNFELFACQNDAGNHIGTTADQTSYNVPYAVTVNGPERYEEPKETEPDTTVPDTEPETEPETTTPETEPPVVVPNEVQYSVNVELLDEEGKQLYVTVDVDENPGVYMTYMVLGFDTNVLEVNYYEEDGEMYPNAYAGGVFGGKQWTTDIAVYDGTSNMANQYGYVGYVNVMCTPATSNVTFANNTKTGNLFEVVFDVKEGMECEDFNFELFACQNDAGNHIGTTADQTSYNVPYAVTVNGPEKYAEPDDLLNIHNYGYMDNGHYIVGVNINNNTGMWSVGFDLNYNASALVLDSVVFGNVFANEEISVDTNDAGTIKFIALSESITENNTTDGNLVEFVFDVTDCSGVSPNDIIIQIETDDVIDVNAANVMFICSVSIETVNHVPTFGTTCTEGQYCTVCGKVLVAAPGHKEETVSGYEATCINTGLTDGTKCSVCGEVLVEQEEIPLADHTPGPEATSTTPQVCTVCGVELAPATGFDPGNVNYAVNSELTEDGQLYVTVDITENSGLYMTYMVLGFDTNVLEVNYYEEDGEMYPNVAAGGVFSGSNWTTDVAVYDSSSSLGQQYNGYVYLMCTPSTSNTVFRNNTRTGNVFEAVFDIKDGADGMPFNFELFACQNDAFNHIGTTGDETPYAVPYTVEYTGETNAPVQPEPLEEVQYSVNVELLDEEGKQLYVTVDVDENPGIYMTYMVLGFDTNVLEVNYYEEDGEMYPNAYAGGVFGGRQWTTDIAVYDGTSNMANQYGYVGYVNVMCTPATSNVTFANNTKTGNLFEVVFDVKEGMECEDFNFELFACQNDAGNHIGTTADQTSYNVPYAVTVNGPERYEEPKETEPDTTVPDTEPDTTAPDTEPDTTVPDTEPDTTAPDIDPPVRPEPTEKDLIIEYTSEIVDGKYYVYATVTNNPGIWSVRTFFDYNTDALKLSNFTYGAVFGDTEMVVSAADKTPVVFAAVSDSLTTNNTNTGVLYVLVFDILDCSASTGFKIVIYEDDVFNVDLSNVYAYVSEDYADVAHSPVEVGYKAPTCSEEGYTAGIICGICGVSISESEIIEKLPHTPETVKGYEATCTSTGLTDGSNCSVCGEVLAIQEVIPVKPHAPVTVEGYAATCTESGLTDGEVCGDCGLELIAQEEIPAYGHYYMTVKGYPATCTEAGLTDGTKCDRCGEILVEQLVIPAKGHNPGPEATSTTDQICLDCGEVLVPALGEDETDVEYEVYAEMTEEGQVYVTIDITENPGLYMAYMVLQFDQDVLEIAEVDGEAYVAPGTVFSGRNWTTDIGIYDGNSSLAQANGYVGDIFFMLTPSNSNVSLVNNTNTGNVIEILFNVKEGMEGRDFGFVLETAAKDPGNHIATDGEASVDVNYSVEYTGVNSAPVPSETFDIVYTSEIIDGKYYVYATVTNNPGVWAVRTYLDYNSKALKLVEAINGEVFADDEFEVSSLDKIPSCYFASSEELNANNVNTGVLYTLVFEVVDCGEAPEFVITIDSEDIHDNNLNNVEFTIDISFVEIGHTPVFVEGIDATCTEDGYTSGYICAKCSEVIVGVEPIDALGHKEVIVSGKNPTCAETGLTDGVICSVCGETLVEQEVIAKKPHTPTNVKGYASTCTSTGLTDGSICSVCGEVLVAQEVIPMRAHGPVTVPGYDATCTETGLSDGKECKFCGITLVEQEVIPALGHSEKTVPGYEATCTETGLTDGVICDVCGETLVRQTITPKLEHKAEIVPGKAPTCTETGLTEGVMCSVCGEFITAQKTIAALGHTPGDWTVVIKPTLTSGGLRVRYCTTCFEKTDSENLSKLYYGATAGYWAESVNVNDAVIDVKAKQNALTVSFSLALPKNAEVSVSNGAEIVMDGSTRWFRSDPSIKKYTIDVKLADGTAFTYTVNVEFKLTDLIKSVVRGWSADSATLTGKTIDIVAGRTNREVTVALNFAAAGTTVEIVDNPYAKITNSGGAVYLVTDAGGGVNQTYKIKATYSGSVVYYTVNACFSYVYIHDVICGSTAQSVEYDEANKTINVVSKPNATTASIEIAKLWNTTMTVVSGKATVVEGKYVRSDIYDGIKQTYTLRVKLANGGYCDYTVNVEFVDPFIYGVYLGRNAESVELDNVDKTIDVIAKPGATEVVFEVNKLWNTGIAVIDGGAIAVENRYVKAEVTKGVDQTFTILVTLRSGDTCRYTVNVKFSDVFLFNAYKGATAESVTFNKENKTINIVSKPYAGTVAFEVSMLWNSKVSVPGGEGTVVSGIYVRSDLANGVKQSYKILVTLVSGDTCEYTVNVEFKGAFVQGIEAGWSAQSVSVSESEKTISIVSKADMTTVSANIIKNWKTTLAIPGGEAELVSGSNILAKKANGAVQSFVLRVILGTGEVCDYTVNVKFN